MNINKKLKAKLYEIHYKLHPLVNIISGQWTVDHTPGSPSKYMTTIYNYFCKKMLFLDFLKVKIYENMLQNAPNCTIHFFFRRSMPPNPPSKRMATPRVASPPPQKKILSPPLANPAYAHELLL